MYKVCKVACCVFTPEHIAESFVFMHGIAGEDDQQARRFLEINIINV